MSTTIHNYYGKHVNKLSQEELRTPQQQKEQTGEKASNISTTEDKIRGATTQAISPSKAHTDRRHERSANSQIEDEDDEPLIDTTVVLPLHSKRSERQRKRHEEKTKKLRVKQALSSIFRLPAELLLQVLCCLEPIDVLQAQLINRDMREFVQRHEAVIAKDIIEQRYWVLSRAFPRPVFLTEVDSAAYPALLDERRQKMLAIHKKPYQHVPVIDQMEFCTCMSCIFAWNNLCMILDLAHWQANFDRREPIPMIKRGDSPKWNEVLLSSYASVVHRSIKSSLTYATILQKHLKTINKTLSRRARWHNATKEPVARLYDATDLDIARQTDEHLERQGPHSFEFPYHRDNYYSIEAYVPNRKWSRAEQRWLYFAKDLHERDVAWTMAQFSKSPS